MPGSPTTQLAEYAAGYSFDRLPDLAVEQAKVIVLDTLAAMLLGSGPEYSASRLTADFARMLGGVEP